MDMSVNATKMAPDNESIATIPTTLQENTSTPGIHGSDDVTQKEIPPIIILVVLLQLAGILANLVVFITTGYSRKIRLKMHQQAFVLSLATADILFLLLVMPFVSKEIVDGGWTMAAWTCQFQGYIVGVTCHASVCSITTIAVNRYYSIVHVAAYRRVFFHRRNMAAILASVWIYALALPVPALLGWGRIKYHWQLDACLYDWTYSLSYTLTIVTLGFLVPFVVTVACYAGIWWAYRKSRCRIETRRAAVQIVAPSFNKNMAEECHLVGQLLALSLAFIVCWMPYLLLAIVIDPQGKLDRSVYDVVANLMVLNAVIDPAFYFFFNRTLRSEAAMLTRRLCCCCCCCCWQPTSTVTTNGAFQTQQCSETTT